jgi:hypothetical protein
MAAIFQFVEHGDGEILNRDCCSLPAVQRIAVPEEP